MGKHYLVAITDELRKEARRLAFLRNGTKEAYQNKSTEKHTDEDTHFIGLLGELAFAQLTGLPVDNSSYKRGDNGADFHMRNLTIDVKTRDAARSPLDLAVYDPTPRNVVCDILVLCECSKDDVLFLGWTTKLVFVCTGEPFQFGRITRWGIRQDRLYPISTLLRLVKRWNSVND